MKINDFINNDNLYDSDSILNMWTEFDERVELYDGNFVLDVLPHPKHNWFQSRLFSQLTNHFDELDSNNNDDNWLILQDPKVLYPKALNGFIHDLAGWYKSRLPSIPDEQKIEIVPNWVCEILSGNVRNDTVIKKTVLHKNKVEYYWLVDWRLKTIDIFEWAEQEYKILNKLILTGDDLEQITAKPFNFPIKTSKLFR